MRGYRLEHNLKKKEVMMQNIIIQLSISAEPCPVT